MGDAGKNLEAGQHMTRSRPIRPWRATLRSVRVRAEARLDRLLSERPPFFLLAVNLLPVACVMLFGWDIGGLMLCYWAENVIIGLFNVPRMVAAGLAHGPGGIVSAVFNVPLFVAHYGLFCIGHGFFIFVLLALAQQGLDTPIPLSMLLHLARARTGLWTSLFGMVLFHGKELIEWLSRGGAKATTPYDVMFVPYGRIGVLHLAIMGGMAFVIVLGQPVAAVVVLGIGKTVLELVSRKPSGA